MLEPIPELATEIEQNRYYQKAVVNSPWESSSIVDAFLESLKTSWWFHFEGGDIENDTAYEIVSLSYAPEELATQVHDLVMAALKWEQAHPLSVALRTKGSFKEWRRNVQFFWYMAVQTRRALSISLRNEDKFGDALAPELVTYIEWLDAEIERYTK